MRKDSIDLFTKYKVYSERELQSRYAILCENYVKTVNIEGQLTALMAKTMILPAALRYQTEVAQAVNATKAAGVDDLAQAGLLKIADDDHQRFPDGNDGPRDKPWPTTPRATPSPTPSTCRDAVLPAMTAVRTLGDKLETIVADDLWPLPTYREMLFIK